MAFNDLYEIDPSPEYGPDDDRSCFFKEDLLQLKHPRFNRLLDVGWYPEGDLIHGRFVLLVYEGDFHGRELHSLETRDRLTLVNQIERILIAVTKREL